MYTHRRLLYVGLSAEAMEFGVKAPGLEFRASGLTVQSSAFRV